MDNLKPWEWKEITPNLVTHLRTEREVEAAVRAIVTNFHPGGLSGLISDLIIDDWRRNQAALNALRALRPRLGKPFHRMGDKHEPSMIKALLVCYDRDQERQRATPRQSFSDNVYR